MSDLIERIAVIAKQNNVEKKSLENLKQTFKNKREAEDNKPLTAEDKKRFIIEALNKK